MTPAGEKMPLSRNRVLLATSVLAVLLHGLALASLHWEPLTVEPAAAQNLGIAVELSAPQTIEPAAPQMQEAQEALPVAPPPSPEPAPQLVPQPVSEPVPQVQPEPKTAKPVRQRTVSQKKTVVAQQPSAQPVQNSATPASSARAVLETATTGPTTPKPLAAYANAKPRYPDLARKRGQQGLVRVLAQVDEQGVPADVRVAQSSGYSLLDEAALHAVRKWRFTPGMLNGLPVRGSAVVPVEFRLQ